MNAVQTYLISVISAAIIVSIAILLTKDNGMISVVVKIMSGLILSITIIKPLISQGYFDFTQYIADVGIEAESYIDSGKITADTQWQKIIKDRVEAYIFDKATALGLDLTVNVRLSENDPYIPVSVSLAGSVSPYTKSSLSQIIENELGIPKENQEWN